MSPNGTSIQVVSPTKVCTVMVELIVFHECTGGTAGADGPADAHQCLKLYRNKSLRGVVTADRTRGLALALMSNGGQRTQCYALD